MTEQFKINGKRGDVKHNVKLLLEKDPSLRDISEFQQSFSTQ